MGGPAGLGGCDDTTRSKWHVSESLPARELERLATGEQVGPACRRALLELRQGVLSTVQRLSKLRRARSHGGGSAQQSRIAIFVFGNSRQYAGL